MEKYFPLTTRAYSLFPKHSRLPAARRRVKMKINFQSRLHSTE